jgi:shikimate kinase
MGTGKSTVGKLVAAALGWRFVDMDAEIAARGGMSIPELFAQRGESTFRQIEHEVLHHVLDRTEVVIATGGGALIDADSRAYAAAHSLLICLSAQPDTLAARLAGDSERPLLKGDWRALLDLRRPAYDSIMHQVDTTDKSAQQSAEDVLNIWHSVSR